MATPISLPLGLNSHQATVHHLGRALDAAKKAGGLVAGDLVPHLEAALDAAEAAARDFDEVVGDHMDAVRENATWSDPGRDPLRLTPVQGCTTAGDATDRYLRRLAAMADREDRS